MFRGATPIALDGKGRLAIPTKYRDMLMQRCEGRLVLTLDPSSCLLLYPFPEWEPIERKLNALPSFDPLARRMQRLLVGSATDLDMDNAGRILLPALLRERAHLEREVVLIGQGNKFEIWNEAAWQAQCDAVTELPAQLDEAMRRGEAPDGLKGFSL
ncbi:transcriptional regulator MraZ [Parasulfuritortus cantonensis]|uniref:Transcriptional regulator MraZ n=1 Tax=Parasulfuritortus cantonensis TaxID=2528202 RepID=A0A4R1BMZ8_9PROT|nr:division/cell wall cluster transcriptional repressor MraZ [Parasulfuritortus cantonensis]TCJ18717.1 transcriptional regulator MraZ [Parasulfuritortus cantonensis]